MLEYGIKPHVQITQFGSSRQPDAPMVMGGLYIIRPIFGDFYIFLVLGFLARRQNTARQLGTTLDLGDSTLKPNSYGLVLVHLETLGLLVLVHTLAGYFYSSAVSDQIFNDQGRRNIFYQYLVRPGQ